MTRLDSLEIRPLAPRDLGVYASVPIRFEVRSRLRVALLDGGLGGMRLIEPMHAVQLAEEIRRYQEDGAFRAALASELLSRSLPTWKESAKELVSKVISFSQATKNRSSNP